MSYIDFGNTEFKIAILIRSTGLQTTQLRQAYLEPLEALGSSTRNLVAIELPYDGKKPTAKLRKEYLDELLPDIASLGVHTLFVCDAEYFKTITKLAKAEPHLGYVKPCALKGFENLSVIYCPNWQTFFFTPDNESKCKLALNALHTHMQGKYEELGTNVLKDVYYPKTASEVEFWFKRLLEYPVLACDIEAFSLKHVTAGIATISFSWDKHSAVVFTVDAVALSEEKEVNTWCKKDKKYKNVVTHLEQGYNNFMRSKLKDFFSQFKGKHVWHNASYDIYNLTYQLFMEDLLDREGMLQGLEILLKNCEDTQLITYLATNSCAGNSLGLKDNSHEFVGNYAIDVKDIRTQRLEDLLHYNAIDTCATFYVWEKMYPKMVEDDQEEFYRTIFMPQMHDIIEMQLTGLVIDLDRTREAKAQLEAIREESLNTLHSSPLVQEWLQEQREEELNRRNLAYKKKQITMDEVKFELNLNSTPQLQSLLYDHLNLPVLDKTDKGGAATGTKTIKKLSQHKEVIEHPDSVEILSILKSIREFSQVEKILTAFISAFLSEAFKCKDGYHRIFGSFKLGGTVSGRLSASNPNIQQIPSGSTFGKLIKQCFVAPKGQLFVMSDFAALEDVVNTLLTKDPAKEAVLVQGFDGHSYRMVRYWPDKFDQARINDIEYVNSLKNEEWADKLRSMSKPISFAMQYLGTWATLMNNCGFSEIESKQIEANYHALYKVSGDWVQEKIQQASYQGYAVGAFGLRIRCPILHKCVLGNSRTPTEAAAESRTLGNAISGQSYCLLNGRASEEFMRRVRNSEYRLRIRLAAHIHDAIYLYIDDSIEVLSWVNKHLIECMRWQELPELHHPQIKISSELDVAYPSWASTFTLPNGASEKEILEICQKEAAKRVPGKIY